MVDAAGLDIEKLPPILPSGRALGAVLPKLADELGLGRDVIVVSGTHDQCAAALGSGARTPNTVMLGLGTFACAVLVHRETAADSVYRQLGLGIEAHAVAGQQVSFIFHGSGGALLKWLLDQFFRDLRGPDAYARMFEEIAPATRCPDVLPYFAASGPLDCAEGEQGAICGLSLAHTRGDILKGALEGIVLYFKEAFNELAERGCKIERIHASGGGAESPLWLQMIADILQTPVVKPRNKECGALGAALLAGAGLGRFDLERGGGESMIVFEREYRPASERGAAHDAALARSLRIKTALSIGNANQPVAREEPSCT
jgi:xylulokinase